MQQKAQTTVQTKVYWVTTRGHPTTTLSPPISLLRNAGAEEHIILTNPPPPAQASSSSCAYIVPTTRITSPQFPHKQPSQISPPPSTPEYDRERHKIDLKERGRGTYTLPSLAFSSSPSQSACWHRPSGLLQSLVVVWNKPDMISLTASITLPPKI